MYYQIPVTDSAGRVIQHLPVGHTERKSNGGIAALFARLSFKKNLVPAQLVQIKSAIEKGSLSVIKYLRQILLLNCLSIPVYLY